MIEVRCPDGSIARFPDGMSDAEIEAILRREFPEPRPLSLELGEVAKRDNGATVAFSASMARYVIQDAAGKPVGFRIGLDAAIDFADALPTPRAPRPVKPVPMTARAPAVSDAQIAHDVESHIRQSESRHRREPSALRPCLAYFTGVRRCNRPGFPDDAIYNHAHREQAAKNKAFHK